MDIENLTFNTSVSKIKNVVDVEIKKFLNYLVSEYKLDLNCKDVIEKRNTNFHSIDLSVLENEIDNRQEKEKEKKKRPINPVDYCLARKPNLAQCTRIKKIDCDYCASHQHIRPFGRIDQIIQNDKITTNSNKLIINQFKIKEKKRIVKLKAIKIENTDYFIDDNHNLYIYLKDNGKYKYIGMMNDNKQIIQNK
jgi:hypothetical protein